MTAAKVPSSTSKLAAGEIARKARTSQAAPTLPARRDKHGFELDHWGLPVCGPARKATLERLGKSDPDIDTTGWPEPPAGDEIATDKAELSHD